MYIFSVLAGNQILKLGSARWTFQHESFFISLSAALYQSTKTRPRNDEPERHGHFTSTCPAEEWHLQIQFHAIAKFSLSLKCWRYWHAFYSIYGQTLFDPLFLLSPSSYYSWPRGVDRCWPWNSRFCCKILCHARFLKGICMQFFIYCIEQPIGKLCDQPVSHPLQDHFNYTMLKCHYEIFAQCRQKCCLPGL